MSLDCMNIASQFCGDWSGPIVCFKLPSHDCLWLAKSIGKIWVRVCIAVALVSLSLAFALNSSLCVDLTGTIWPQSSPIVGSFQVRSNRLRDQLPVQCLFQTVACAAPACKKVLLLRLHGCEVLSFEVSLSLLLGSNQAILICLIGTGYLCTLLAWWSMLAWLVAWHCLQYS